MFSLNRVSVIGYQTQPITIRKTPGGTSVTDLNLVVPSTVKTDAGQQIQSKSFHTVTIWGPMADVAGQFARAGSQIYISGRLQTDSWEDTQSHEKRSKTKLVATDMILLDPKSGQTEPHPATNMTAASLNRADLLGNVTKDPEMRTTTSGQKVLTIGVATNDRWKDKATGEMKEKSEFHNVVVWGALAEEVALTIKKGVKVFVSGRVQTRSFETQAGAKRSVTEVVAETVSQLGLKSTLAAESIENSMRQTEEPAGAMSSMNQDRDEAPAMAVPAIDYSSEIKVEDLPF